MTIQEEIGNRGLQQIINRYNLQVIHEDNNTYVLEDMNRKKNYGTWNNR